MPQPLHSLDLPPATFSLSPKLKRPKKGRSFATIKRMKAARFQGHTKKRTTELLRGLEKELAQMYFI